MLKRTPLYEAHVKLGARLVEFGGWEMPVQYSSIVDEHLAVRRAAGVFDISHMGEVLVSGTGASDFLNSVLTNDVRRLGIGQAQYTLMCNPAGGVIDDLYVYRLTEREYLLIINASRIDADWDWLQSQYDQSRVGGAIDLRNVSAQTAALAIQGPRTAEFIDAAVQDGSMGSAMVDKVSALKKNELGVFVFSGHSIYVARTGYTGEDGFEIVAPAPVIHSIWDRVLAEGHAACLQPAGLGARDTLRTEMGYPLYGHELTEQTSPLEAGLGKFVAWDKGEFVGSEALAGQKATGVARKCIAFTMQGKTPPPRPDYALWTGPEDGQKIGAVTSGTHSPSLNLGIGMGYVPTELSKPGTALHVEIRGRRYPAVIVSKPIYRRNAA
jgi:aminomethyltransferase